MPLSEREKATWQNGKETLTWQRLFFTYGHVRPASSAVPPLYFFYRASPILLSFSYCHALTHILIHGYRQHFRSCPTITITVTLFRGPYSISPVDPLRQTCSKIS